MSRLLKFVAIAVAALSVVALLPQTASAVEGLGAHKGSLIFFPFWNNNGGNRTYFRIGMANEINDAIPLGQIQLHMFYEVRNPGATWVSQTTPACLEFDRHIPFTENDWELINTYDHNQGLGSMWDCNHNGVVAAGEFCRQGWAFAYAVLYRPDTGRTKLVWDRFFSDTFIVDTTGGTIVSWNNYQEWANEAAVGFSAGSAVIVDNDADAFCDYLRDVERDQAGAVGNDVCTLGFDNGVAGMGGAGFWPFIGLMPTPWFPQIDEYWVADFPDTFWINYFTSRKRLWNGTYDPTMVSITPVHVNDTVCPANAAVGGLPKQAWFNAFASVSDMSYQYDMIVCDDKEVCFSGPANYVICHDYMDVNVLTNLAVSNNRQGYIEMWEVDNVFGPFAASEDAVVLSLDTLRNYTRTVNGVPYGPFTDASAVYATHDRTTDPISLFEAGSWWANLISGGAFPLVPYPQLDDNDQNIPADCIGNFPPLADP
jgi:hypothetical protein